MFSPSFVKTAPMPRVLNATAAFRAASKSSPGMNLLTARRTKPHCGTCSESQGFAAAHSSKALTRGHILEARPESPRRIFGAHATHLRVQLLRCSLTHLRDALAALLVASPGSGPPGSPNLSPRFSAAPLAPVSGRRALPETSVRAEAQPRCRRKH